MLKQRILTILGILIIGVAIWAYFSFQEEIVSQTTQFGEKVIVAKESVPVGTVLTQEVIQKSFRFEQIPKKYVATEAVLDPKELVGKKTLVTISVNTQVTKTMLDDHVVSLSPRERLYSFPIDFTKSAGGTVFPNDVVDINVTYKESGETQAVAKGIIVYSVQDAKGVEVTRDKKVNTPNGPAYLQPALVTIAAEPDLIQKLEQSQKDGTLFLVKYANENLPE